MMMADYYVCTDECMLCKYFLFLPPQLFKKDDIK